MQKILPSINYPDEGKWTIVSHSWGFATMYQVGSTNGGTLVVLCWYFLSGSTNSGLLVLLSSGTLLLGT